MKKTKPALTTAQRKARQRAKMREWIQQQTDGKISTAEGYVMYLMQGKMEMTK